MAFDDRTLDEAAGWAVRTGDPSFGDWDGFTQWLESDPAHALAYDLVTAKASDAADLLAGEPQAANDDAPVFTPRRRWLGGAISLALIGVAAVTLWPRGGTYVVETAPGETRLIALGEGDEITLGGGSSITLDKGNLRFAELERGQALFSVRHDPSKPFRVEVGEEQLIDIGTVFDVRFTGRATTVAVAKGAVVFNPTKQNVQIDPGHFLSSAEGSDEYELGAVAASQVGEWRDGRLTFQNATLADVADDLSRATGMRFAASGASGRRVSGSLLVAPVRTDPGSVGALLGVNVRKNGSGWMLEAS